MYGRTNAGGGVTAFAFIFATYPVGSVCTATDGSRTLKLKDTSGYGVFYVPYAAAWTVTATDGAEAASQTVEITTEGQSVNVELSYRLYLYKNGDQCVDVTGGWSKSSSNGSFSLEEDHFIINGVGKESPFVYASTNNKIDLTPYNTLYCELEFTGTYDGNAYSRVGCGSSNTSPSTYTDDNTAGETVIVSVNLENVSGDNYVMVGNRSATPHTNVYNVWLE